MKHILRVFLLALIFALTVNLVGKSPVTAQAAQAQSLDSNGMPSSALLQFTAGNHIAGFNAENIISPLYSMLSQWSLWVHNMFRH